MSTPQRLREQVKRDEGTVLHVYTDSLGYLTIGTGRLIDKRKGGGITQAEADYLLSNDIQRVSAALHAALPWLVHIDEVRRSVLFNMAFQMGPAGLLKFKRTLELVANERWQDAAKAMLQSTWAKQTPERAQRLAKQMTLGVWQ